MGLPDGHPEKEGVLVDIDSLTTEIKQRLEKKACGADAPAETPAHEPADLAQKVKDLL